MSSQNMIVRGVPLEGGDCRRLLEIMEVAERLGAPEVALDVWHYGVDVVAADNLTSPKWQFITEFRWRRMHTQSHRAFITPPVAVVEALHDIDGDCTRIAFRKNSVLFINIKNVVEVRGRTIDMRGKGPIGIIRLGMPIVLFYPDLTSLATLSAGGIDVHLIHGEGGPQAYITNAVGQTVPIRYDIITEFERNYVYHYDGNALNIALSIKPVRDYIIFDLMGSLESPILYMSWKGHSPVRPTDINIQLAPTA
jgi:hypothetical protein